MLLHRILSALIADETITTKDEFHKLRNALFAKYGDTGWVSSITLIEAYRQGISRGIYTPDTRVWRILRKRAVRSLSGVSVISLLTKEWGCPGKCVFCPTYEWLPKSYITDEPAVQRAEMNQFDPIRQIQNRLESLQMTGNAISKCDVRIIWGTWSVYPQSYRDDFIRAIYDAHTLFGERGEVEVREMQDSGLPLDTGGLGDFSLTNTPISPNLSSRNKMTEKQRDGGIGFGTPSLLGEDGGGRVSLINWQKKEIIDIRDESRSREPPNISPSTSSYYTRIPSLIDPSRLSPDLLTAQRRNESAESRVIGIAIETRPDWIDEDEIRQLRRYGITRVEIGYQTTIDEINAKNIRWHGNAESIRATRLLKDAGLKVVAHMMPGLLGSTPEMDRDSMDRVWNDPDFRPDEMKIYPMVVTPHSELETIWRNGDFTPYDDQTLIQLMAELQSTLPEWVRLNRMYRDIPAHEILAGSRLANLRQLTETRMHSLGLSRHDISAREIRAKINNPHTAQLDITSYEASGGVEYFLQYIDTVDRTLFALCRLRIPSQIFSGEPHFLWVLDGAAIIRELHVFGDQLQIGQVGDGSGQHMGFGKRLLAVAETIVGEYFSTHMTESGEDDLLTPGERATISHLDSSHITRVQRIPVTRIAIIAGVGVRPYYARRGYHEEDGYMIREMRREKEWENFTFANIRL